MAESKKEINGIPYKIVGLIGSIVVILSIFVGAVSWVSINMANNAVSIQALREGHRRHEALITKNSEILIQQKEQGKSIDILTNFMTQGGRFTEKDGQRLHDELSQVKDRFQHYKVLETELSWIKKSINRMETDIARRFDVLQKKLDVTRNNNRRENTRKLPR